VEPVAQGVQFGFEAVADLFRLFEQDIDCQQALAGVVLSFDYAPTGQTVAGMWSGDDTVKRNMVKAVKGSWGLALAEHDGQWGIKIGTDFRDVNSADGIVDLGNGLCFRREAA
jgi:hypothetical protein